MRVIFRPSLATPSLPAHRSLILQNPSAGRLLRVSTLDIHKKTYEDLRNGWYKCVACDNDLAVPDAIMLRCASRCSVIHFTCKKPWCMSLGARSHCPGCDYIQMRSHVGANAKRVVWKFLRLWHASSRESRISHSCLENWEFSVGLLLPEQSLTFQRLFQVIWFWVPFFF